MAGKMVKSWPWLALAGGGSWEFRDVVKSDGKTYVYQQRWFFEVKGIKFLGGLGRFEKHFRCFFLGEHSPNSLPKASFSWRPRRRSHFLCFFDTSNDSDDATETSRQLSSQGKAKELRNHHISWWWESQRISLSRRKWYWPTNYKQSWHQLWIYDFRHDSQSLFRVALWTKCSTAIHSWLTRWRQDQWFWIWPDCLGDYWNGAKLILRLQMPNLSQDFRDEDDPK